MSPGEPNVSILRAFMRASVALALTFVPFLTSPASGQSPAARPDSAVAVSEPTPGNAENKVAAEAPRPKILSPNEIDAVKTENAEVRELLRKMEEQQKMLLEQADRLQRQLDGSAATDVPAPPVVTDSASASLQGTTTSVQAPSAPPQTNDSNREGTICRKA